MARHQKIQTLPEQKIMNSLFAILNLPETFELNLKTLEKNYFDAQRQWHPDRFIGKGEDMRGEAATRSVLINDAYETLKNPLERAKHMLELKGVFIDDETNPPQDLLMEMMELRERIHDSADDGKTLLAIVEDLKKLMSVSTQAITDAFKTDDIKAAQEETLCFGYLGKAMEEAHMMIYRVKANKAGGAH